MDTSEGALQLAMVSEYAERYDDMMTAVIQLAKLTTGPLSQQERTLFSTAFRHVIGPKRTAWRVVSYTEQSIRISSTSDKPTSLDALKHYCEKIEAEIAQVTDTVVEVVQQHILPKSEDVADRIFAYKTMADYRRYEAEVRPTDSEARTVAANAALECYKQAFDLAAESLPVADSTRLGLALNYSVHYYEIMGNPEQGCVLAKEAFDTAISGLETLPDHEFRESSVILQILRDNLNLWTADIEADISENASAVPPPPADDDDDDDDD
ncbi:14-3-3 family protein [Ramicandelaber brevisporus]|nr:14-3-3 family protein [Ramicandelaber brevisporus]